MACIVVAGVVGEHMGSAVTLHGVVDVGVGVGALDAAAPAMYAVSVIDAHVFVVQLVPKQKLGAAVLVALMLEWVLLEPLLVALEPAKLAIAHQTLEFEVMLVMRWLIGSVQAASHRLRQLELGLLLVVALAVQIVFESGI
jgi:hypothetical protein